MAHPTERRVSEGPKGRSELGVKKRQPDSKLKTGYAQALPVLLAVLWLVPTAAQNSVGSEHLQRIHTLSSPLRYDKYPSLAATADGTLWAAWTTSRNGYDRIACRQSAKGGWGPEQLLDSGEGLESGVRLAAAPDGSVWALWHGRRAGRWGVYYRRYAQGRWSPERPVAQHALHPAVAVDDLARVWAVWETPRPGGFALEWSVFDSGEWSEPLPIESPGSDRRPTLTACPGNQVHLAWDSTRSGNFDVWLGRLGGEGRELGLRELKPVTRDAGIDDSPSLACAPNGDLWIAWNSMRGRRGAPYRADRHSGDAFVRVYRQSRLMSPPPAEEGGLAGQVSFGMINKTPRDAVDPYWHWKQTQNYPRVFHDGRGAWVIWRTDETGAHNFDLHARYHDGDSWSSLIRLTRFSPGRDEWPAAALNPKGGLFLAWEGQELPTPGEEERLGGGDVDSYNTKANRNVVLIGELAAPSDGRPAPMGEAPIEAFRPEDSGENPAPAPSNTAFRTSSGRYRIFFGDPHTHSILSDGKTGLPDQLLLLSRDSIGLDFAVVSDHSEMGILQPTEFAELQLTARIFDQPERFVSLSGWEWTAGVQYGHRVALFQDDGGPPLSADRPEGNSIEKLYRHLSRYRGIVSPHHTGQAGWGRWNPDAPHDESLEPLFEIASWHGRFEYYGNPWEGRRQVPGHHYQDALRRGRRVGVMAASDTHHLSPGEGGLTAVLATRLDRTSIFEALRNRRCYATSGVRIHLEFELEGHPMGSAVDHKGPIEIKVRVEGTAAVDRVEIVRNVIDTFAAVRMEQDPQSPEGAFLIYEPRLPQGGRRLSSSDTRSLRFSVVDQEPPKGEVSYYVRVTQADGHQAWSSPIWVQR